MQLPVASLGHKHLGRTAYQLQLPEIGCTASSEMGTCPLILAVPTGTGGQCCSQGTPGRQQPPGCPCSASTPRDPRPCAHPPGPPPNPQAASDATPSLPVSFAASAPKMRSACLRSSAKVGSPALAQWSLGGDPRGPQGLSPQVWIQEGGSSSPDCWGWGGDLQVNIWWAQAAQ